MVINEIDLEKIEFLTDLERNIFIIPKEFLKDYQIAIEKKLEETPDVSKPSLSEGEKTQKKYEHDTVYLFNGRGIYELPCKLAYENILSEQRRDYFIKYLFQRQWLDVEPIETDMISLFLYDIIKGKKERDEAEVKGYSISSVSGHKWTQQANAGEGKRTSGKDKADEKKDVMKSHEHMSGKIQRPVDTVVHDKASISKDAESGEKKADNKFFENFSKMSQSLSDFAGLGGDSDKNTVSVGDGDGANLSKLPVEGGNKPFEGLGLDTSVAQAGLVDDVGRGIDTIVTGVAKGAVVGIAGLAGAVGGGVVGAAAGGMAGTGAQVGGGSAAGATEGTVAGAVIGGIGGVLVGADLMFNEGRNL